MCHVAGGQLDACSGGVNMEAWSCSQYPEGSIAHLLLFNFLGLQIRQSTSGPFYRCTNKTLLAYKTRRVCMRAVHE